MGHKIESKPQWYVKNSKKKGNKMKAMNKLNIFIRNQTGNVTTNAKEMDNEINSLLNL